MIEDAWYSIEAKHFKTAFRSSRSWFFEADSDYKKKMDAIPDEEAESAHYVVVPDEEYNRLIQDEQLRGHLRYIVKMNPKFNYLGDEAVPEPNRAAVTSDSEDYYTGSDMEADSDDDRPVIALATQKQQQPIVTDEVTSAPPRRRRVEARKQTAAKKTKTAKKKGNKFVPPSQRKIASIFKKTKAAKPKATKTPSPAVDLVSSPSPSPTQNPNPRPRPQRQMDAATRAEMQFQRELQQAMSMSRKGKGKVAGASSGTVPVASSRKPPSATSSSDSYLSDADLTPSMIPGVDVPVHQLPRRSRTQKCIIMPGCQFPLAKETFRCSGEDCPKYFHHLCYSRIHLNCWVHMHQI